MATIEELESKIQEFRDRHAALVQMKASVGGELRAKKEELAALVQEIKDAGYNPRTIKETRDKALADLERDVAAFDASLTEAEEGFAAFNKK